MNPTPEQILSARKAARLTQAEAANLVFMSPNSWATAERGEKGMSPQAFELFLIKSGQHPNYKPA